MLLINQLSIRKDIHFLSSIVNYNASLQESKSLEDN